MRQRLALAACLQTGVLLLACGGNSPTAPTIPSPGSFPVSASGCPYYIAGLSTAVVDSGAQRLEARLAVDETAYISLAYCGSSGGAHGPFNFSFTNPGVVRFGQDRVPLDPNARFASGALQGARPGQTSVTLDFEADDGNRYRTTLGYCPDDYCSTPRPIDVITVVTTE
jgi:hypothetical protein